MKFKVFLLLLIGTTSFAQVTGLAGWDLFVDPGHSQTENMGVNGYSEAESNLVMALHLKDLLLSQTDIDTVKTSRLTDTEYVGLSDRSAMANGNSSLGIPPATWYHSIHSNAPASTPSGNNVLLLYGESTPGVEKTWAPGGRAVSYIMSDIMSDVMRIPEFGGQGARGDCVFYGVNTGPYLSVNRRTTMPSELSESGYHTIPSHNSLQMNDDYARMVAYSMFWTVLDFHGIDRPFPGLLAGFITDPETDQPINGATVSVNGQTYTTDTFESLFYQYSSDPDKLHNGYYFFEGLPDSSFELIVSADGYYSDTLQINELATDFVTFRDINLVSNTPPVVVDSYPANGDQSFPAWEVPYFDFSRGMDEASVEAAFSVEPHFDGNFYFTPDSKRMAYLPADTMEFLTDYTFTIAGSAIDAYGHPLDGNMDGTGGDDWTLAFRTSPPDISGPVIVDLYPTTGAEMVDLRPIITIVWDEELNFTPASSELVALERLYDLQVQETILEHHVIDQQSILVLYAVNNLLDAEPYRVRIFPGFEDLFGNAQTSGTLISFTTSNYEYAITNMDNFESGVTSNWWEPGASGSTTGTLTGETGRSANSATTVQNINSTTSMKLNYGWDLNAGSWLIREYLAPGTAPRSVHFTSNKIMQAFIFGDNLGNKFRFCVDDNIYGSSAHEVSPWYTIDWYGWRLVSWDMTVDGTGTWIGDGNLDGTLEFDSIQLTHTAGKPTIGTYYIDDLRVVNRDYLAIDGSEAEHPLEFALLPNYPNPFNPWTSIPFTLAERAEVQIRVYNLKGEEVTHLISGAMEAGRYVTRWNASNVSSGLYLIKMSADGFLITRKITVLK